jgi:murein DD-endopeptidase MepM/ murein hydrolase activator NlpD
MLPVLPMPNRDAARISSVADDAPGKEGVSSKRQGAGKKKKGALNKTAEAKKARDKRVAKAPEPMFLKAPLSYRRVSSGFSYSRVNPITNLAQPHLGIDYSASSGTPVHSIGAGRVQYVGWDGGYGKTIRVVHNNGYISQYGHLSRFARNIMMGKRVRKGETIGYVGTTGLATGPHLDFRITHLGSYINPLKLDTGTKKLMSRNKQRHAPRG